MFLPSQLCLVSSVRQVAGIESSIRCPKRMWGPQRSSWILTSHTWVTRESHVSHKVAIGCCHEPCPTSRTNRFCPICSAIQGTVPTVSTAPVVERPSGFNMKSKSLKARPSSATMRNWDTVAKSARMTPHWRHPSHIVNTMYPALSKQRETAKLFQRVLQQTQKERSTMVNYKFSQPQTPR